MKVDKFLFHKIKYQCCRVAVTRDAQIAQLVEQRTENPRVVGSIPTLGTSQVWFNGRTSAFQAEYVGSIPITCLYEKVLRSIDLGTFSYNRRDLEPRGFVSRLSARSAHGQRSTGPYVPHHLLSQKPRKFNVYEVFFCLRS